MAQKLTKDEVTHVAHLARLEVSEQELETYTDQLSAILDYVDQLSSVDTGNVESNTNTTGLINVLQDDASAADSLVRDEFLEAAPASQLPHVKVKAVLE